MLILYLQFKFKMVLNYVPDRKSFLEGSVTVL